MKTSSCSNNCSDSLQRLLSRQGKAEELFQIEGDERGKAAKCNSERCVGSGVAIKDIVWKTGSLRTENDKE